MQPKGGYDSIIDVGDWLERLGLAQYAEAFEANDIDGSVLTDLTSGDLAEIGVRSVGHRRRILAAIASIEEAEAPEDGQSGTSLVERRNLTVMFCDLMDSTLLSVSADPEEFRDFITNFRRMLAEVVRPFGGHIAQYLGDGVYVYFGYPKALEYGAESAVACALDIIGKVEGMEPFAGHKPQVRIGVATGLTVVGPVTSGSLRFGESAVGETPNLAARLQAEANPNSVVICDDTRTVLGSLFQVDDRGLRALKGFKTPVQVWSVVGQAVVQSRFDGLGRQRQTELVGRATELEQLLGLLGMAEDGNGRLAAIFGESGMGKSRLAHELIPRDSEPLVQVPVLQCSPYNTNAPFHMFRYFFSRAIQTDDGAPNRPELVETYLARWGFGSDENLALLGGFLGVSGLDRTPLQGLRSIEIRKRLTALMVELFCALAARSPVLVLEDLQWVDPSSAELLGAMQDRLRELPLLQIMTIRPGFWPDWLKESDVLQIRLDALPLSAVSELVRNAAGADVLPGDVVSQIAERCGGNPIFAEELTRGYLTSGKQDGSGDRRIPTTLADALLHRLEGLTHGNILVRIGSVIGNEFPIDLLFEVSDLSPGDAEAGLAELVDAQLMRLGQSTLGRTIGFCHALLREATYDLLLSSDRRYYHRQVASTMRERFPKLAADLPHMLATQLEASDAFDEAAEEWVRAGDQAVRRSAYVESISRYQKALYALSQADSGASRDKRELSIRLNLVGSMIAASGFKAAGVLDEMERVESLARRTQGLNSLLPTLANRWALLGGGGDVQGSFELALQIKNTARDGRDVDRLLAHRLLGTSMIFIGQFSAARVELEQFFDLFDADTHDAELLRVGPSNPALMSMVGLSQLATIFQDHATADKWRRQAFCYAANTGQAHDICNAHLFGGCLLDAWNHDAGSLAKNLHAMEKSASDNDLHFWQGHVKLFRGLSLVWDGEGAGGLRMARDGLGQLLTTNTLMNCWAMIYGGAATELGELDEAAYALSLAEPAIRQGEIWLASEYHRIRATLLTRNGTDPSLAAAALSDAEAVATGQGAHLFLRRIQSDREQISAH